MDTLSHGLWALAIFWGTSYRWWAFLLGMIPDLLSFGIYFMQRIIGSGLDHMRPDFAATPDYVYTLYSITHSFVTWAIIGIILYIFWRKYWPIVGAPMLAHIALDIPTHCSYFPTPFLEPISDVRYCGVSWGTPAVFYMNWICLGVIFSLIAVHQWQKRKLVKQQGIPSTTGRKKEAKKKSR